MIEKKLIVLHIISSLKVGGAEILLCDLINQLKRQGIENHVIYFHEGPIVDRLRLSDIPLYHAKGLICLYDPIFFYRLARLIQKINPDCIHTSLWAANFAGRILGKLLGYPLVSAVHLDVSYDGFIRNLIDRYSFFLSGKVIAISDEVAHSLTRKEWISAKKISVIKNGIDYDKVKQRGRIEAISRQELGLCDTDFVIGTVGRFIARKNYSFLIKTFKRVKEQIPHAKLVMVGMGPEEQLLRDLAETLMITNSVHFVIGKSAYGYYNVFDCFVLPSLQEGLSIALLEALCFKLPVIVSSNHHLHDVIVNGKNGFIIDPNDELSLRDAIIKLAENIQLRQNFGTTGYNTIIDNHSSYEMARSYDQIYKNLLQQGEK